MYARSTVMRLNDNSELIQRVFVEHFKLAESAINGEKG